jgi:S-adenosylmethionine decarboxylase
VRDLAPDIVRQRLLIEGFYSIDVDSSLVEKYLIDVAAHLNLRTYGNPIVHAPGGVGKGENAGFDAFIPLIDSGISLYVWSKKRFFATVLFTCKSFEVESALQFTRNYFGASDLEHRSF